MTAQTSMNGIALSPLRARRALTLILAVRRAAIDCTRVVCAKPTFSDFDDRCAFFGLTETSAAKDNRRTIPSTGRTCQQFALAATKFANALLKRMEVCVDVQTGALWRIASTRLQRTGEIVVELAVNRLAWSSRLSPAQSRLDWVMRSARR
jgi:hypothetical protein